MRPVNFAPVGDLWLSIMFFAVTWGVAAICTLLTVLPLWLALETRTTLSTRIRSLLFLIGAAIIACVVALLIGDSPAATFMVAALGFSSAVCARLIHLIVR
jgi:hypothetical protein